MATNSSSSFLLEKALQSVQKKTDTSSTANYSGIDPSKYPSVEGHLFKEGEDMTLKDFILHYKNIGFQGTNMHLAMEKIKEMLYFRSSEHASLDGCIPEPALVSEHQEQQEQEQKATIFLGFTSNQVSCGNREIIKYLVKNSLVSAIVTTAGAIEEDIIKCLAPTVVTGSFRPSPGALLRKDGLNRIGNLIIPNDNYCLFEDWLLPHLEEAIALQQQSACPSPDPLCKGESSSSFWTPSTFISFLGSKIEDQSSILYWATRNGIPIFSPALTDGSLGDMIFFNSFKDNTLILDIVQDLRSINRLAMKAVKSGIICLGGGLVKHHICNANLMRNGADWAVFVTTAQEFDGSDAGASPDEAMSWGKIKTPDAVKVSCDATIAFPLIVAGSFMEYLNDDTIAK